MKRQALLALLPLIPSFAAASADWEPTRDRDSLLRPENRVSSAVGVYISPRGQEYFRNNLEDLLRRQGLEINEAQFPGFSYSADEPLRLDRIGGRSASQRSAITEMRDLLTSWFRGFEFNDPKIQASVRDVRYSLKIRRMGLKASTLMTNRMGGNGIVLTLEGEIPELRIEVAKIRSSDLANDFLNRRIDGETVAFGLNRFWTQIKRGSDPLKIALPFLLETDRSGKLSIRALQFRTNFPELYLEMGFQSPILMPEVQVQINSRKMVLDTKALERDLLARQNKLLKILQAYLTDVAEDQIATRANAMLADLVEGGPLFDVNTMYPVGLAERDLKRVKESEMLRWAISPQEVRLNTGFIHLDLAAFFEDPVSKQNASLPPESMASHRAVVNGLDPNTYDMAIGVNQGVINRLLHFTHARGFFRNKELISYDPKTCQVRGTSRIRLTARPEIRFTNAAKDEGELLVNFYRGASGFMESLGLKGGLNVALKVKLKIDADPKLGPRVRMAWVNPADVKFDERDVRSLPFIDTKKKVREAVADAVKIANEEFVGCPNESALLGASTLGLPETVAGVPIRFRSWQSDTRGNLIMYVEYGDR